MQSKEYYQEWGRLINNIKESIHQEDITILNIFAPDNISPKYMKQKLLEVQGEINKSIIIIIDFNTALSIIDRTSRQKTSLLLNILTQSINITWLTFVNHSTQQPNNTHYFQVHMEQFCKTDYILALKTWLDTFNTNMFSIHTSRHL